MTADAELERVFGTLVTTSSEDEIRRALVRFRAELASAPRAASEVRGRIGVAIARRHAQLPEGRAALCELLDASTSWRPDEQVGLVGDWRAIAKALSRAGEPARAARARILACAGAGTSGTCRAVLEGLQPTLVGRDAGLSGLLVEVAAGRFGEIPAMAAVQWLHDELPSGLTRLAGERGWAVARRLVELALAPAARTAVLAFVRDAAARGDGAADDWYAVGRELADRRGAETVGVGCLLEALARDPCHARAAETLLSRLQGSYDPRRPLEPATVALLEQRWPEVHDTLARRSQPAWPLVGRWLFEAGSPELALRCWEAGLRAEPTSSELWRAVLGLVDEGAQPAGALAALREAGVLAGLAALAEDADPSDDLELVRLIGLLDAATLEPTLVRLLRHRQLEVRCEAARVLGRIGSAAALPALRAVARRWFGDAQLKALGAEAVAAITARCGGEPGALSVVESAGGELAIAPKEGG